MGEAALGTCGMCMALGPEAGRTPLDPNGPQPMWQQTLGAPWAGSVQTLPEQDGEKPLGKLPGANMGLCVQQQKGRANAVCPASTFLGLQTQLSAMSSPGARLHLAVRHSVP